MMSRTLRTVFAGSMLVGMTAMMHNAIAQEAAPQKIESVQVTGTRITTPGTTSTSPISSVTAEEIKSSQPVAVEEFFKGLPALFQRSAQAPTTVPPAARPSTCAAWARTVPW
jgi:outer membrane cobalamin receptor